MKNQYKLILIALVIGFYSCSKDFLDKDPLDELSASVAYNDEAAAEGALAGAYAAMTSNDPHIYRWMYTILGDMRADNSHSGNSQLIRNAEHFESKSTDNEPGGHCFREPFVYISAANAVLDNVPNIEDPEFSEAEKNSILGQAYFLRAYNYFHLVRYYGGVPLQLSNLDGDIYKSRSTEQEVYSQIEKDLLLAESLLPKEHATNFLTRSRATQGTVQALLAKAYADIGDYEKCAEYAEKVINNGVYSLLANYDYLFDDAHENSAEAIFEIQHVANTSISTYAPGLFLPPGTVKNGVGAPELWPRFSVISHDLINAFDNAGDLVRKASTTSTVTDRSKIASPPEYFNATEPVSFSYKLGRDYEAWGSGTNVILIRLADIILLRAEALNKIGNTGEAINLLNQIRNRVNLPNTTATSSDDVGLAILNERRLELALEGERFFDVVRHYGKQGAADLFTSLEDGDGNNLGYKATIDKLLLPIPQSEIESNPNMSQNPGY
ncbi:RagB/SusD family nutrient uptake outer membrane protein [Maribacter sp.]|uniref:RagB/SusD family nutrient uptake outer membrane protein n=1 Tax=Maribacter sp. TaxID=1897614 RepID=UPI0025B89CCE|nr:RagB/SusD family nutrient uptake outer membrane protein [Maribacter sp.]